MERNFESENMEDFLRRNVDGLRMRPSARVWKGISSHLNRRRRYFGIILGTSLLLTTAVGYQLMNTPAGDSNNKIANPVSQSKASPSTTAPLTSEPAKRTIAIHNAFKKDDEAATGPLYEGISTFTETLLQRNEEPVLNSFTPTIVDSYFQSENSTGGSGNSASIQLVDPLSIESVFNSYQPKRKKIQGQIYFTPKVSYRRLSDNLIDNITPHKPAFGFELGYALKRSVSKVAKLRAGLQFNINSYEIKTYDSYAQLATIRLVDRNGVDYEKRITYYNNFSGKPNWLHNFYLQASLPVGVEVNLIGDKDDRVQFGMASTLQPTYLISDKAYLISADYKNYTEMPTLVRRWNVNTSLETFVAYSTGHLNWQVGPQVRYQMLSSYLKKYPVKENLFDFGLKVGISVNK